MSERGEIRKSGVKVFLKVKVFRKQSQYIA